MLSNEPDWGFHPCKSKKMASGVYTHLNGPENHVPESDGHSNHSPKPNGHRTHS